MPHLHKIQLMVLDKVNSPVTLLLAVCYEGPIGCCHVASSALRTAAPTGSRVNEVFGVRLKRELRHTQSIFLCIKATLARATIMLGTHCPAPLFSVKCRRIGP